MMFFLCDQKACKENCNYPTCKHTTDITHAKNFSRMVSDKENIYDFWEQEKGEKDASEIRNE